MKRYLLTILLSLLLAPAMALSENGYVIFKNKVYYDKSMRIESGCVPEGRSQKLNVILSEKSDTSESNMELVVGADAKTFKILGVYGIDKNHVFFKTSIITDADPATFTEVERAAGYLQDFYYKDKNHVYYHGKALQAADAATFRYLTTRYAIDKNNIYGRGEALDVDPDKYKFMKDDFGGEYIIGNRKVCYEGRLVNGLNPAGFTLLGDSYATDGLLVINYGQPVPADAASFRPLLNPQGEPYRIYGEMVFADKDRLYHRGKPIEGTNANSRVLGERHILSNETIFYELEPIPNADPVTFVSLSSCWGKDKRMVYCQKRPIKTADPATFKAIGNDWFGFDKKHYFENDKIVATINGSSFRHIAAYLYIDDEYAYIISGKLISKTPVDGKTFENVGWNGKAIYKDKNHTYEYFDSEFRIVQ